MSQLINPKSISFVALAVAGGALSLSVWSASTGKTTEVEREHFGGELTEQGQAAAARAAAVPSEKPAPSNVEPSAQEAPSRKDAPAELPGDALDIKRLVVTHAIDGREPAPASTLSADGEPIYAFVELSNETADSRKIVVKFENDRKAVGFVKLAVPANQNRWRTWALTRRITEAGKWVAVISDEGGEELARREFSVAETSSLIQNASSAKAEVHSASEQEPASESPSTQAPEPAVRPAA